MQDGDYVAIPENEQGWRWSAELGLYLGVHEQKLRYFTAEGMLVPNFEEETARQTATISMWQQWTEQAEQERDQERLRAEEEHLRAEQAEQERDQERQRAERLAAYLRSQGINPDDL